MTMTLEPPLMTDSQSADTINLYQLGMLFVVKCRYWSCRAGNDADELQLSTDEITSKAIASFGSQELLGHSIARRRIESIDQRAIAAAERKDSLELRCQCRRRHQRQPGYRHHHATTVIVAVSSHRSSPSRLRSSRSAAVRLAAMGKVSDTAKQHSRRIREFQ